MEADFSGYATKNGLKCSDGRTIMAGAFKHNDGVKVPLVWQHQHDDVENVLGHAMLENREDGVYAYGYFNDSDAGKVAKEAVKHGDVTALSIYARQLRQRGDYVLHGDIKEVSLVLSGANPGAFIDNVNIKHGDSEQSIDDEAIIYTGLTLEHENNEEGEIVGDEQDALKHQEETVKDVFETLSDKQQQVVYYMIGEALDSQKTSAKHSDLDYEDDEDDEYEEHEITHSDKGQDNMARNVFEQNGETLDRQSLSHSQIESILGDAEKNGSLKESILAHADEYGITNIDMLFPEAKTLDNRPEWVKRRTEWVAGIINGASKSPFSRIKSMSADITHDEARAKGYIKGNLKKDQFFAIKSRTTTPKTIYKRQKLDRDDIIDITDFDVVVWLKEEMRVMLDEEIARAVLIGDGREVDDEDKIDEENIRPIATDHEFYTHPVNVPANTSGNSLLKEILRQRKHYKGSGRPSMYTTEDVLTDLLLLEDKMNRRLYDTEAALASALRVKEIIPVEVMEDAVTNDEGATLIAVIVNIRDYTIGADKGGKVSMFDDFDIDYNQHKYLIETRLSGALTKHKTAQAIWRASGTQVTPGVPTFDSNVITIPSTTGVTYTINDVAVTGAVEIEEDTWVMASPDEGYYFAPNSTTEWEFSFQE